MAQPTTIAFEDFILRLGNGATPEVFTAPCAMTTRSFEQTADTQDTTVPDCDDEAVAVWVRRRARTKSAQISAEGIVSAADLTTWRDFFANSTAKNCRLIVDLPGASGGGFYEGSFLLTTLNFSAADKDVANISVTLVSAGAIAWTANA